VIWGRNFEEMLLDVPNCGGLKYIPETQVNELGLQWLGYSRYDLLIYNDYISAFNHLVSMSVNSTSGGVVVIGQPRIGMTQNSLLYTITFLTLASNSI
jgi:hypothetical protein